MKKFKIMLSVFMVLLIISISVAPSLALSVESLTRNVINETLELKMNENRNTDTIPVYIWYNDISQSAIDKIVKEKTGLTEKTLSTDLAMPDATLLNQLKTGGDEAKESMEAYLEETETARLIEKENTDLYINTRRKYAREAYIEKSNEIKSIADIDSTDIIFDSQYAPFIICELTKSQINKLNKDTSIEEIGYHEKPVEQICSVESNKITTGQYKLETDLNLTGDGVKVGMVDEGHPLAHDELNLSKINSIAGAGASGHATDTARILVGEENGFAKDISLYSTGAEFGWIEMLVTRGVSIINFSFSWSFSESETGEEYAYNHYDKWIDHISSTHRITVIASAGNDAQGKLDYQTGKLYKRVASPAMGYNVIAVGAYSDYDYDQDGECNKNDDQLRNYSGYKNTNGTPITRGIEKPDVVMPCNLFLGDEGTVTEGGTSIAAPVLTAIVAQILELKPSLSAFPQAIKAIVMASCHRKVLSSSDGEAQETMSQGITERQGAGAPDAWTMACIVSQGTYGVGTLSSTSNETYLNFTLPKYSSSHFNFSFTWLRNTQCSGNDSSIVSDSVNLDMEVYDSTNILLGESKLDYSSTEMSYIPFSKNIDRYSVKIMNSTTNSTEDTRYGYAYSTNTQYSSPLTNDGIYYLKNKSNGKYLDYNETTSEVTLSNVFNPDTQQWIIKEMNQYYVLYPVDDILREHLSSTNPPQKYLQPILTGDNNALFYDKKFDAVAPIMWFVSYEVNPVMDDGFFTLLSMGDSGSYALSCNGDDIIFSKAAGLDKFTDNMQWGFEKLHYRNGDCNFDGKIDIYDVTQLQYYLAQRSEINNKAEFVYDADYDGGIKMMDVTKIQRIVAGIED